MSTLSHPFNILLVEDELPHQRLFVRGVARAKLNASVTCVETGRQALEALHAHVENQGDAPLLVVLDINIPGINGIEVLGQIRANPKLQHLPVAVLSTSDEPDEVARCKALGCFAYYVKPVDMEHLAQVMLAELLV